MNTTLIRLALCASLLGISTPALAYLSPSEVFTGIDVPPNNRSAEDQVEAQQKASAAARNEAHSQLPSTEDEPAVQQPIIVPAQNAAPDEEHQSLLTGEGQYERRMDRMNTGFPQGTTIIIQNGEAVVRDRQTGAVLHSGAPRVTATGPAEFLALSVLFLAATGTFLWVRSKELSPAARILK